MPVDFVRHVKDAWLGHAIEGGRGRHCVGAHVGKDDPVASVKLRKMSLLVDAVKAITGRAPDAALKQRFIIFCGIQRIGCQFSVVEQQAVEGAIDAIIHVIHEHRLIILRHFLTCKRW